MTYTPGQDSQQPYGSSQQQPYGQQPAYGQQPGYGQQAYAAPQYDVGQSAYAGYAAAPPKSDRRTLGLWALITGLSGFLIPIGLNSIAAIVLGIFGLVKEQAKGMSITGIVTGGFCLFIWLPVFWGGIVPVIVLLVIGSAGGFR